MIYAGFWRRFTAMIMDSILMIIPAAILGLLIPWVGYFVVVFLYKPFFESSAAMGTPGKIFMGMQVTDLQGNRITFRAALVRYLASLLSGLCMALGYMLNLITARRQTLHDMVADTVVIRRETVGDIDWINVWIEEFKHVFNIVGKTVDSIREAPASSAESQLSVLESLHKLYQQGALSESEYLSKKEEILKKI